MRDRSISTNSPVASTVTTPFWMSRPSTVDPSSLLAGDPSFEHRLLRDQGRFAIANPQLGRGPGGAGHEIGRRQHDVEGSGQDRPMDAPGRALVLGR